MDLSAASTGSRANVKIDHNFNSSNKLGVTYTYERMTAEPILPLWPDTFGGSRLSQAASSCCQFHIDAFAVHSERSSRAGMRRTRETRSTRFTIPRQVRPRKAFYPELSRYPSYGWVSERAGELSGHSTARQRHHQQLSGHDEIVVLWRLAELDEGQACVQVRAQKSAGRTRGL